MTGLRVTSAPVLDPATRVELVLPEGLTLAEIVAQAVPGALPSQLRVLLVTERGAAPVDLALWPRLRPRPGVRVVIRAVPGEDGLLRNVLLAVVSVAALAVAPQVAGFFHLSGRFAQGLVAAGLTAVGTMLVNALIPLPQLSRDGERRDTYSISGWRNELRQGAPVPFSLGRHRYAPPFAATSFTHVTGDDQYVTAVLCAGYGPLRISDIRIGDTPLEDFDEVSTEIREGRIGDAPLSLYPRQVLEESTNADLVRPFPRDDAGEIIEGAAAQATPVRRFTASDATEAAVLIGLSGGLFRVDDDGDLRSLDVRIRIRQRLNGVGAWSEVTTLELIARKREPFLRQFGWVLPSRGRWQIEVTRMTAERTDTQASDRTVLSAIQSVRPEYPITLDKPLALVAVRIKATHQLNGALDSVNMLLEREGPVWDGAAWSTGYSRNPASAFLTALRGPQNPYPVSDAEIDWDLLADWYQWCDAKGLKYDRIHDQPEALGEMLAAICAAGRATPRHDGLKWGVVIDRPQELAIDHVNPRNSGEFGWQRSYFTPPHAFRVRFNDETAEYQEAERVVPWPGHTGPIDLTETIDLPGKTDPAEIWIEARRRMYELIHRIDAFSAIQDGASRVATRGDLVMGSFDVLSRTQVAARVRAVSGQLVELDEEVDVEDGTDYGLRFRVYENEEDVIGTSLVRPAVAAASVTRAFRLSGTGAVPAVGEVVHLGPVATESMPLRIRSIEPAEDFAARLLMVAAAPEIDTLTDAEMPPAWDGRVGEVVEAAVITPAAPRFVQIATGVAGTGDPDGLEVILGAGGGSSAIVTAFDLDHRAAGATAWTTITVSSAEAGAAIDAYAADNQVELRARAFSGATDGPYGATVTVTIGAQDPEAPAALDASAIDAIGSMGHAIIGIGIPRTNAPDRIQLYRVPAGGTLDRTIHAAGAPFSVSAGSTVSHVDGDATRKNLLSAGSFGTVGDWTQGAGWTIADGVATHAAGSAGELSQALSLTEARTYRVAADVIGRLAGSVMPRLIGGTPVDGSAVLADGRLTDRLTALSGNTGLAFAADANFDGALDAAVAFLETSACIPAGAWEYWVEPQTSAGIAGPVSGPFMATVS
ncbi:phage tail protein [Limimaricola variabilis]|uniref:TipJ family phage tail tip protein n=1 Tax=Limimaricola variabilis TaxID=1492771 RepID=UPI002AC9D372|nr:phage tail protein [Limimaricola variabilis]WPY94670.1 phage tail protein [Limimaricola variabilis]